jgi:phytoene dehydrogenase-like protein
MSLGQLFSFSLTPNLAGYRMTVGGLYLCGSGTHPGGGVMGIPGPNASKVVIEDHKNGERKERLRSYARW